ncbi:MAG: response regulator, partial [Pseudomonadota bacterium]
FYFEVDMPLSEKLADHDDVTFEQIRALVIDDNTTNVEVLKHQLEAWQIEVYATTNPREAVQEIVDSAQTCPYSLALIDAHMPGMDGFAVANAINEQLDETSRPTMLLLSSADLIRNNDALAAGFTTILRKPVTRDELVANIRRALADTSREQAASQKQTVSEDVPLLFEAPVLLVEDNKVNQKVTGAMLAKLGVEFDIVEDGQQAVDAVSSNDYAVVLMDCQMPVMDGFEATRVILEAAEQTERVVPPIVALTANALQGDAERCYAAGMTDYMSKPFSIAELRTMLRKYAQQQAAA